MTWLEALILAFVEGITEFLPVSSTGHLVLTSELLSISQTDFVKSFEIIIQLGAICAVLLLYTRKLQTHPRLIPKIIIGFIPSAVAGLVFYDFIKSFLIGNTRVTLFSLALGGFILILLEKFYRPPKSSSLDQISLVDSLKIGIFQILSMVPGVSRAGATIAGGMLTGLSREVATEFSFLLAIPTMLGATTLDLVQNYQIFSPQQFSLLAIAFIGSFVTALVTIKYFLSFVKSHTFTPFAVYRIALATLFLLFLK